MPRHQIEKQEIKVKIIETTYRGWRFRSRLEARWAVYFDSVGLIWEYEKEGFELEGGRYLPDFWFPQTRCWGEVKPELFGPDELRRVWHLSAASGRDVVLLIGQPDMVAYPTINARNGSTAEPCGFECLYNPGHGHICDAKIDTEYANDEHRFFICCGVGNTHETLAPGAFVDWGVTGVKEAVLAARGARFEYGEARVI